MKRALLFLIHLICIPVAVAQAPAFSDSLTLSVSVQTQNEDFLRRGYGQAVLSFSLLQSGKPAENIPLTVKPIRAENRGAVMPAFAHRYTGLSWDVVKTGGLGELSPFTFLTDGRGKARLVLFDILGERTLTLAVLSPQGRELRAVELSFGKGPLSRFASPFAEKITWRELANRCRTKAPDNAASLLPTVALLQTVSLQGKYNPNPAALGAAVAAGWPTDERYLAERFVIPGRARHVDLLTGSPHGFGGVSINTPGRAVCLRPEP